MAMLRPEPDGLPPGMTRVRVLRAYALGVADLGHLADKTVDWGLGTPNPAWTLLDLAGHVLSIARYDHRLLNAAIAGQPIDGLPRGDTLADMNAAELSALEESDGPERLLAFDAVARRYGERLAEVDWTATMGDWEGLGPLSIASHTLLAVGEWQLHAWDVARSFGWDHRPDDPEVTLAGRRLLPGGAKEGTPMPADPWAEALIGSGRRPRRGS